MAKGLRIGIETKIDSHPALEQLGFLYESIRRTALSDLQKGRTEDEIEKSYQSRFGLQWAWSDSIATDANSTFKQLKTAKKQNLARISQQINKKIKKAKTQHRNLVSELKKALKKGMTHRHYHRFSRRLLGLKSKINKIASLKKDLKKLKTTERLHICFGSRKLFNAQHHLKENGYENHQQWLSDWRKLRSGRFLCIGKGVIGGGTMTKISHISGDKFNCKIQLPRSMSKEYGNNLSLDFEVKQCRRNRRSDLLYALENNQPITVQVYRREHKQNQWYIHLTTYVQSVPTISSKSNGCLGIDFNADSIEWAYVKSDGNIASHGVIPFEFKGLTTGQRESRLRDAVSKVVKIASDIGCPIAIESLDFSKKKASMSEESTVYNSMLSSLSYGMFRDSLDSRGRRYGIEIIRVNPAYTSVIGMVKFMQQYGLNSGTAAAMAIARRAMRHSERVPTCLVSPEDEAKHPWSVWRKISLFLKRSYIKRHDLFNPTKALEDVSFPRDRNKTGNLPSSLVSSA